MTARHLLIAALLSCTAAGPWAASSALAQDNIERSCKAGYAIYMNDVQDELGRHLARIDQGPGPGHAIYDFSARRGCGRTVPNRCRQRASEALMQCMVAHAKAPASTPAACTSEGVQNYRLTNLEKPIQAVVCPHAKEYLGARFSSLPDRYFISTTVKGFVDGDDGCGGGDSKYVSQNIVTLKIPCTKGQ